MGQQEADEALATSRARPQSAYRGRERKWWDLSGNNVNHVSVDLGYEERSAAASKISDAPLATNTDNVFVAPEAMEIYKPVDGFEGAHRFNPSATWTLEQENKLVRKLDWRITLTACIMFFSLQLDRGNLSQALSDNMLDDIGLSTNEYNNGQTIFFCTFLFSELPSQLISKRIGPDTWIPIQMISWSVIAASQAAMTGKHGYYVTRALLGLVEGGFIPDVILYLSYFYTSTELPTRLSWFWSSFQSTSIVGALLAYGILHLRGHGGLTAGWRYLFIIEGCLTGLVGIFVFLYLPASPTQTARHGIKGFLRPKNGWFTDEEETIMVTRILRDDPGKSTMHNRQGLNWRALWEAISDYDVWPIYLIGISWSIPTLPPQSYITLTLKALGFSTFQTNLLTIPTYILFILQLLFWTWTSEKVNERVLICLSSQFWVLPGLVALVTLPPTFPNSDWSKWALCTLIIGYPYVQAVFVGLASRNSGTVRTRTVASSLYNMAVQVGNITGSQIYRTNDAPYYYTGNKVLLGIVAYNIVVIVLIKAYYILKNRHRDKIWDGMTREERLNYLATSRARGNKRLDFRFAH